MKIFYHDAIIIHRTVQYKGTVQGFHISDNNILNLCFVSIKNMKPDTNYVAIHVRILMISVWTWVC
jgi:hypothetical protein